MANDISPADKTQRRIQSKVDSYFIILLDLPSNPAVFHKPAHTKTAQKQLHNLRLRKWGQHCLVLKSHSVVLQRHISSSCVEGFHFFFFFCGADTQLCNLCWLFSTFSPTDNCTESSNVLKQELMDAGSIWIIGFGHLQIKICDWWEGTMVSQQLYIWWYKIQRSQ